MILVTLRGAAAGWSPDTARAAQRGAELWSWILDNSSRTPPPLSTDNNSRASLPIFAHLQYATFSHIQKSKVGQRGHFVTKKCATNDVVRQHLAIFHIKGQKLKKSNTTPFYTTYFNQLPVSLSSDSS